jgi:hypothetical protein
MEKVLCTNSVQRQSLAVSLCFSSGILMAIEALTPGSCAWMGFTDAQSFTLSTALAVASIFMGSLVLSQLISDQRRA